MALVSVNNISVSFGGPRVLDAISCQIEPDQRICLLGRNGAGKSTLMKVIAGQLEPDSGSVAFSAGCRIAYFSQLIPDAIDRSVFALVAEGLGRKGAAMADYYAEEKKVAIEANCSRERLYALSEEVNALDGWGVVDAVHKMTSRMSLNAEWSYAELSGGQKRRVFLAQALISEPDLLLLDEPTNHLDVESIEWLESFLLTLRCSILFVTHDRMLLKKIATRIIEIDRGSIVDWACDYTTFLKRKQQVLDAEGKRVGTF